MCRLLYGFVLVSRRVGTRLELGMVGAYGHENDMAKFSQSEVNAMIKER